MTPSSHQSEAPRRILQVEVNEDGTVGGSHQALYDLARNLDPARYEPVVMFYQQNRFADLLREEGFEVHVVEAERAAESGIQRTGGRVAKTMGAFQSIAWRRRFLREHRIDAVHMNNHPRYGHDDWLPACLSLRMPIVSSVMGYAQPVTGTIQTWLYHRYDRYLSISTEVTRQILAQGLPEDRMTQIYLGVDIETIRGRVSREAADVRRELGVGEDQLLVLMTGNIRPWKGQYVLLRALAELEPEQRAKLRVVFAGAVDEGSKEYWEKLQELEAECGLSEIVDWLGFRTDIPDLYAAADLAVHCSTTPEPFGLVLVEALAVGTPVAASVGGGPSEIMTPSAGWLYDPSEPSELADVLREVIGDPDRLKALGEGAAERAERFTVRQNVEETMDAYDGVFDR